MYRNILVPLDGSTFGEKALAPALELARKSGATMHLAHVLLPISAVYADAPPFVSPATEARLQENQKLAQRAYLENVTKRLLAAGAPGVESSLLDGEVAAMIRQQMKKTGTDLVVMATHGYGPMTRFWLGSVTDELVRGETPAPVLLIRPGDGPADLQAGPPLKRILAPLDGAPLAEQILPLAAALARTIDGTLELLRVVRPLLSPVVPVEGQSFGHMVQGLVEQNEALQKKIRQEALDYLNKIAAVWRERGVTVSVSIEEEESPVAAILQHARAADVVALATHGYRGLSRLFLGSVADKVIRGVHVPVLVHKPKKES